jgi:two-component sensor histidine kinase
MQVIGNLITLRAASLADPKLLDALEDVQDRIRAIALVHEKIYRSANIASPGMKDYLADLVSSLLRAHCVTRGTVTAEIDAEDVPLPVDAAVPLGLIVNELVTNSLKHAFPGGRQGRIFLSVRREGAGMVMRYRDDGPGPPREPDPARIPSLGLKLVYNLAVRQLRGDMEIRHDPPAEFVFRFDTFAHLEKR